MARDRREQQDRSYDRRTVTIRRVAKVTAGGKRLRFSAVVVAGDRRGSVGIALGRGLDTRSAVSKAERKASQNMVKIEVVGDTIPHEIRHKYGAAEVLLRPARPGAGIIAGSAARTVLEMAGIENVYCKQLGTNNIIANTYCTFEALQLLRKERVLKRMRKMRERIGIKEQMDEERKKRELKKKKNESKSKSHKVTNKKNVFRKDSKKK